VRVAELGIFTKAADALGLPKVSVSLAVQQLENRPGTQLLHRTTRKVQLTPDGQVFMTAVKTFLLRLMNWKAYFKPTMQVSTGLCV
jgi:DNA-binding transcriptional LysR family regulator